MAYLFDLLLLGADGGDLTIALVPLPLIACALLALTRPVAGALGGAGALLLGTAALRLVGLAPPSTPGIENLLLSETVAGGLLVAVVVWKCGRATAAATVAALVAAGLAAMVGRAPRLYLLGWREILFSLFMGLVVLIGGCVVGMALRSQGDQRMAPRARTLMRRQWPLAVALVFLLFVDLAAAVDGLGPRGLADVVYLVPLLLMLATGVCAFLGPLAPVRWTLTAAALVAASALALAPFDVLFGFVPRFPPPTSVAAAQMALVAYVVRSADRRQAASCVAALAGADLLAVITTAHYSGRGGSSVPEFVLVAAFLLVVSVATGQYFRSRDRERHQTVQVAVTGAQQAERMALARELHDVVAHHVTGIVVQAQAARLVAETYPAAAVQALAKIENSGTEALAAMRMLVDSMRGAAPAGGSGAASQATSDLEADLRALADGYGGPAVQMELDLPVALPPEAGRSVLRLVQESLTNVGKHARNAQTVQVRIETDGDELRLRVTDDAPTPEIRPTADGGGYGLVGMRERVELLGGRFTAGPGETAGWTVDARIPLRRDGT
ncbi:Signal transduction histidine kinase [Actinokineospora iranica]|uniref:histidine kinase n=1 Tax=Actinokineospora iranica TaxID=1271860 RepID=A0A1G6P5A5_9PSEU|nr:Signal transduction histidine kinase [Actinokineospora iranica]